MARKNIIRRSSIAPYTKYQKRPYDYSAMYARFPHLAAEKGLIKRPKPRNSYDQKES